MSLHNPVGIRGIEFVEFCSPRPDQLHRLFLKLGFSKIASTAREELVFYGQNELHFIINQKINGQSAQFKNLHGPSISSIGLSVEDAEVAFHRCLKRGAKPAVGDYQRKDQFVPAVFGLGGSLIYFIDARDLVENYSNLGFTNDFNSIRVKSKGLRKIDHLTQNLTSGSLSEWSKFYQDVMGFSEIQNLNIGSNQNGVKSLILQSPCKTFFIQLNEGAEDKSLVHEYLEEHKGPGFHHLALLTDNLLMSLEALKTAHVETQTTDQEDYSRIFERMPQITEDREELKSHQVHIQGDEKGYQLQTFTKKIIGALFFEFIQRTNDNSLNVINPFHLFKSFKKDQAQKRLS